MNSQDWDIRLSKDVKLEIQVDETNKTVGPSKLFHLYADLPIDLAILGRIITAGINSLSEKEKKQLLKIYEESY